MELTSLDFIIWQVFSFVIITSLIIAVRLFFKKDGSYIANYLIALVVIFSAVSIFNNLLAFTGIRDQFPWLLFIPLDFSLYIGPLMYFYFKNKLKSIFRLSEILHLIIPVFFSIFYTVNFLKPLEVKADIFNYNKYDIYFTVETIVIITSLLLYLVLCYRILNENTKKKQWQQSLKKWLTVFLKVVMILIISEVIFYLFSEVFDSLNKNTEFLDYVQLSIDVTLLGWFSLKAYQQHYPENIFKSVTLEKKLEIHNDFEVTKNVELTSLIRALEVEKLYQNQDLNLQILSRHLNMSKNNLSYLIKENFGKSFTTFINDYRLNEVLEKLQSGEQKQFTVLALAYDSGFSSKTTFYRYFNEKIGMPPILFLENFYLPKSV